MPKYSVIVKFEGNIAYTVEADNKTDAGGAAIETFIRDVTTGNVSKDINSCIIEKVKEIKK